VERISKPESRIVCAAEHVVRSLLVYRLEQLGPIRSTRTTSVAGMRIRDAARPRNLHYSRAERERGCSIGPAVGLLTHHVTRSTSGEGRSKHSHGQLCPNEQKQQHHQSNTDQAIATALELLQHPLDAAANRQQHHPHDEVVQSGPLHLIGEKRSDERNEQQTQCCQWNGQGFHSISGLQVKRFIVENVARHVRKRVGSTHS